MKTKTILILLLLATFSFASLDYEIRIVKRIDYSCSRFQICWGLYEYDVFEGHIIYLRKAQWWEFWAPDMKFVKCHEIGHCAENTITLADPGKWMEFENKWVELFGSYNAEDFATNYAKLVLKGDKSDKQKFIGNNLKDFIESEGVKW